MSRPKKNWLPKALRKSRPETVRRTDPVKLNIDALEAREVPATLTTDLLDYSPGSTATIYASDFQAGEAVQFVLHRVAGDYTGATPEQGIDQPWTVTDGGEGDADGVVNGNITTSTTIYETYLGGTFQAEATGQTSGLMATTQFTDAGTYTPSISTNPTTVIANSSATYTVTIKNNAPGSNAAIASVEIAIPTAVSSWGLQSFTQGWTYDGALSVSGSSRMRFRALSNSAPLGNNQSMTVQFGAIASAGQHTFTTYAYNNTGYDSSSSSQLSTGASQPTVNVLNASSLAVGAASGTYGGTTTLTATLTSGATNLSGKTVNFTLNGTSVGSASTNASGVATLSNVSLSGINAGTSTSAVGASFAGDSSYAASSGTADLTVNKKSLTGSFTVSGKTYDGTLAATITGRSLAGVLAADAANVSLTGGAAAFDTKNAGTGKTVTGTGFSLTGAAAGNYQLASDTLTTTADITTRTLTSSATGVNKVYDGSTSATINLSDDRVSGDTLAFSYSATFGNKNVGTAKPVSVTGISLSGTDAGNYQLASTTASTTASVTPKALTATGVKAQAKTYDGTTAANVTIQGNAGLNGVVTGDVVSLSTTNAAGTFSDKNVGSNKTVTITGLTIGGADAGNYTLNALTDTANITAKSLTVTGVTAGNKEYDGSTSATLNTPSAALSGVVGGDAVYLGTSGAAGSFADKNAGTAKTVTITGLTISGADAGNYTLTQPTTTANITAKALTGSFTVSGKTYDGTLAATITGRSLAGVLAADAANVSLTGGAAAFDTKNAGTGKTVTGTGFSLTGAAAGNYQLASDTLTTTADIAARAITVTADANSKEYGDADPALTYQLTSGSLVGGDAFSGSLTRAAGQNVGTYAIQQGTLTAGSNYALTYVGANLQINKAVLTVTANNASREYGADNPTFTASYSGFKNNETAAVLGGAPSLSTIADATSDFGSYTITAAAGTLSAANYSFAFASGTLTVTKATLTVTPNAVSRVYGTANPTLTGTIVGQKNGDLISATYSTAATAASNVGSYDVTASAAGEKLGNYTVVVNGENKLTVTQASSAVTLTSSAASVIEGNQVTFTATVATAVAGVGTPTGSVTFRLDGADLATVQLSSVNGVATASYAYTPPHEAIGKDRAVTAVYNGDGNFTGSTSAAQSLEVKPADEVAPVTQATAKTADNATYNWGWTNQGVTITLEASDNLSGVANTEYSLDDGVTWTTGTSISLTDEGSHTVKYRSVDNYGNAETAKQVTVKIDKTAPELTLTATLAGGGTYTAGNWTNKDVTVSYSASDARSGVVGTAFGSTTFSTDTANGQYTVEVIDLAGNKTTETFSNIKIDKTAPVVSGTPSGPTKNASGWYTGDVSVQWAVVETGSGASTPENSTIFDEGSNLGATVSVTDAAGNTGVGTVSGIKIDRTAPSTMASTGAYVPGNWTNQTVTVTLTTAADLSGVAATYSRTKLGTGSWSNWTQGTSVELSADGVHTVEYYSVDVAGNEEAIKSVEVKVDKTMPEITWGSTGANGFGWNNSDVTLTWTASDVGSGVNGAVEGTLVFSTEGEGLKQTVTVTDRAGNSKEFTSPEVNLDKTKPTATAVRTAANSFGWNKSDVTVTLTGTDTLSGLTLENATQSKTLSAPGAGQGHTFTMTDKAGNTATFTLAQLGLAPVNIDLTEPTISGAATTSANGYGWYKGDVEIAWTVSDALSGIDPTTTPASSTITGEGDNLAATAGVSDKAGNSNTATVAGIKIDRHAPTTGYSLSGPAAGTGWYNSGTGTPTLTLAAIDTLSGVDKTYYQDSSEGVTREYTGPVAVTGQGVHIISFWSVDKAGNVEAVQSLTIQVDTVAPAQPAAPDLTAASDKGLYNNDNVTNVNTPTLTGTAEAGSTVAVYDGATLLGTTTAGVTGAWSFTTAALANGAHSFTVTATDVAGNTSAASAPLAVTIDTVKPTVVAAAAAGPNGTNGWYTTDVTVHFTVDGTGTSVVDGPANQVLSAEGDAVSSTAVKVTDLAGNESEASNVVTVQIDKTKPTISAGVLAEYAAYAAAHRDADGRGWNNTAVTAKYSASDAVSGLASDAEGTHVFGATGATAGAGLSYTFVVTDRAGNSNSFTVSGVNIDVLAPQVSLSRTGMAYANDHGGWNNTDVTVTYTATDVYAGTTGNSGLAASLPGPVTLTEGNNQTASFAIGDVAGNVANVNYGGIKIDKTKPSTTAAVTTGTQGTNGWYTSAVTVTLTRTDNLSGVAATYYRLNGGDWAAGTSVALTTERVHTIEFYSVDVAGNVESTGSFQVKVDTTAPTATAERTAANGYGWNNSAVTVTLTGTDATSGLTAAHASQRKTFTGEGAGQGHTFTVTDEAGNSATFTLAQLGLAPVNIDLTGPSITAAGTAGGAAYAEDAWTNKDVTVTFAGSDALSGVATLTGPVTVTTEGAHQKVTGTVVDKAGNAAEVSFYVSIDKTAPDTSAENTGQAGWTNQSVTVTLDRSDDRSGVAATHYRVNGGAWAAGTSVDLSANGVHTVEYYSVDVAGNAEAIQSVTVRIDKTPPTTGLTKASGQYAPGTPFTWGSQDALSGVAGTVVMIDGVQVSTANAGSLAMPNGTHTVTVTTTDQAGNVTTDTRTYVTGTAVDANGNLVIVGTDVADVVRVSPVGNTGAVEVFIGEVSQGVFGAAQGLKADGMIVIYGLKGGDDIQVAGSITRMSALFGGDGDDRMKGGSGPSILVGGDGADNLLGGNGRDLLIGGDGADRIIGNAENDILIAGITKYDTDLAALVDLAGRWAVAVDFKSGVMAVENGDVRLNTDTVADDKDVDTLTGSAGTDLFMYNRSVTASVADKVTDLSAEEQKHVVEDRDFVVWVN